MDSVLGDDVAVIQSVSEKKALSWIKIPHQALVSLSFDDRGIVFGIRPDAEISAECRLSEGQEKGLGPAAHIRCGARCVPQTKTWLETKDVMSDQRVFIRQEALPDTGGVLASSLTVAVVTAAIGWYFVQEAGWQAHHLISSVVGFFILASFINVLWISQQAGRRFGEANQATLLRSGLVCLIGSALVAGGQQPEIGWHLAGLIAVALALDGVDGFLARRLNLASDFGARFDMEIDALLLLILSLLVWQTGQAGAWVLLIGSMRYAFVAASWFCPRLGGPLRPSFRRKTICALQGIALLACLLPPLDQTTGSLIALIALLSLVVSFGLDIGALLRAPLANRSIEEGANT